VKTRLAFVAVLSSALCACSAAPMPNVQLGLTEKALAQAEAVGATDQLGEYSLARGKLERARAAMQQRDYKQARVLAEQSELDARLAEAKVLTQKSDTQIADLNRQIDDLRKQLGALQ
jgi:chromosome segregation ATPase